MKGVLLDKTAVLAVGHSSQGLRPGIGPEFARQIAAARDQHRAGGQEGGIA